jgi:hypothetical protein
MILFIIYLISKSYLYIIHHVPIYSTFVTYYIYVNMYIYYISIQTFSVRLWINMNSYILRMEIKLVLTICMKFEQYATLPLPLHFQPEIPRNIH